MVSQLAGADSTLPEQKTPFRLRGASLHSHGRHGRGYQASRFMSFLA